MGTKNRRTKYKKKVPINPPTQSCTFTVYNHISKGLRPSEIWRNRILPKRTLIWCLKRLSDAGLIKKVGYGTWDIIDKDLHPEMVKRRCKKSSGVGSINPPTLAPSFLAPSLKPNTVRGHAFVVTLRIPIIKEWKNRKEILDKIGIQYKELQQGQRIALGDIKKIWLCDRSIIFYTGGINFYADEPEEACFNALDMVLKHIRKLENALGIGANRLKINKGYRIRVSRSHYALVKNAIAKHFDDPRKRIHVYDQIGLWFIIDNSFNLHEAEFVRPETNIEEGTFYKRYMNDLNKTRLMPSTALQIMTGNARNMGTYSKELMAHVEAVKTLGHKTSVFSDAVTGFKDEIKAQLGKLGETIRAQSKPKLQDKMVSVEIIKDTGKFYSILNEETHLYDLKEGAKIYLSPQSANALIKNGFAREMMG